jgi:hypothetical protein
MFAGKMFSWRGVDAGTGHVVVILHNFYVIKINVDVVVSYKVLPSW